MSEPSESFKPEIGEQHLLEHQSKDAGVTAGCKRVGGCRAPVFVDGKES